MSDDDDLFELAVDFWFEPPPSIKDAYWPVALAVTWIAWREGGVALNTFEQVRQHGRRYWLSPETADCVVKPRAAENMLLEALRTGTVTGFGVSVEGQRQAIKPYEWIDLRLFGMKAEDQLDNAVWHADASVRYSDLRVTAAEVLAVWPEFGSRPHVEPPPRSDGARKVYNDVYRRMVEYDFEALDGMKVAALKDVFGSNSETCRQARNQIRAEKKFHNN